MKRIIVLLVFALSMIGCKEEKCKECITFMYFDALPIVILEKEYCGEELNKVEDRIVSEGNYYEITICP